MPELPEVETIKRELSPFLKGEKIRDVIIKREEIIGFPSVRVFKRELIGKAIKDLERRGKYLIFLLSDGSRLLFHLKLSGRLILHQEKGELRHERLKLVLNKRNLSFVEPRMFGRVFFVRDRFPNVLKGFLELGPEPLAKDFNESFLAKRLKRRKGKIKSILLDQRVGCGLGNIYTDESLFLAGIHPERSGVSLMPFEIRKLVRSIKKVLKEAIRDKGTTLSDYFRPNGRGGNYQLRLRVKDREGKPCRRCGTPIERIKIGNRSTHFCPQCQK
ncbi:MAG: bifunctional DNA-formamidopyrimidine glycosylase/DNA-(apurinic or apyrimidinic site) lyase [candidate division WOR-3 bacterium]